MLIDLHSLITAKGKKEKSFHDQNHVYKLSSKYFSISIVSRIDSAESIEMGYPVYEPPGYPYPKH